MTRYILFIFIVIAGTLQAQENMRVERCSAINWDKPVYNIYIDDENRKFVSNSEGLFQVHAANLATPVEMNTNEESLLQYPGGNQDLRWTKGLIEEELKGMIPEGDKITAAFYDEPLGELWLGTRESGFFLFWADPKVQFAKTHSTRNTRMESDQINDIYVDEVGRHWIATDAGVFIGLGRRWGLEEKYFQFQAITYHDQKIWLLAEDMIWVIDDADEWSSITIDPELVEGEIKDIAFDKQGQLWIASELLTRYNLKNGAYKVFDGADYFTSSFVNTIAVDQEGAVWVGTQDKGLYLIEKETAMTVTALVDQPLSCEGNTNNASLKVYIKGGQPPFTYNWDKDLEGDNPQGLGPGEYIVKVTDGRGKQKMTKGTIPNPRMTLTVVQEKPQSPEGTADGSARLEIEGGQPDYKIAWDNGERELTAVKMTEGEHSVTVTDENGCTASTDFQMTRSLAAVQIAYEQTQTSGCSGNHDNAIEIKVTGGKGPFQYAWNDPTLSGSNPTNLKPGEYQITITDAIENTVNATVIVQEPTPLETDIEILTPASTDQMDGKAQVNVSGGTEPYTYKWDNEELQPLNSTLGAGNHSVTVTDAAGCNAVATIEISEDILPLTVTIQERAKNKCFGDELATLDIIIEGGKKPFSYSWSDLNMQGGHVSGLAAGTYALTVTDMVGNSGSATYEVSSPTPLASSLKLVKAATSGQKNGEAMAEATGGTAPYTFRWDNGGADKKGSNMDAGVHVVTITDQQGCTVIDSILIQEDILPLAVNVIDQKIDCFGQKSGSIQLEVSGGKGPFNYQWSDPSLEGNLVSGLGAGNYQVTISDNGGNTEKIEIQIQEPEELQAVIEIEAPATTGNSDGKARIIAAGGTPAYTYNWSNGETTQIAQALSPGEHQITITDQQGCTVTDSILIQEDILPLAVNVIDQKIDCFGQKSGSIQLEVSGGKGPFNYQWSDPSLEGNLVSGLGAGNYQVTISDNGGNTEQIEIQIQEPEELQAVIEIEAPATTGNSDGKARIIAAGGTPAYTFNWSNGETTQIAQALSPGEHQITITDVKGCTVLSSVLIEENILPLQASIQQVDPVACFGNASASVKVSLSGGKGPFIYQWNDPSMEGDAISDLSAGTYRVTVTDASGNTQNLEILIPEPKELEASIFVETPASTGNADGKARVDIKGGMPAYTYNWDNGETSQTAISLSPGEHQVTITDAAGCNTIAKTEITENILPLQVSLEQTTDIFCSGAATASLKVNVSGGKEPYTYKWNDEALEGNAPADLPAKAYEVVVTDITGASKIAKISLSEPNVLKAEITEIRPATDEASNDGKAQIIVSGGSGNYSYAWEQGSTGDRIDDLAMGDHTVTVTDDKGCSMVVAYNIPKKILPKLTAGKLRSGQVLRMESLQFDADSTTILPASVPVLEELFVFMKDNPEIVIQVEGHTNNIPPHDFCDKLSTDRAKKVAQYITYKGVSGKRVYYKGYGKRKPLFSNDTADGRRKNQRVEIRIMQLRDT